MNHRALLSANEPWATETIKEDQGLFPDKTLLNNKYSLKQEIAHPNGHMNKYEETHD